jgi:hypothetical protein
VKSSCCGCSSTQVSSGLQHSTASALPCTNGRCQHLHLCNGKFVGLNRSSCWLICGKAGLADSGACADYVSLLLLCRTLYLQTLWRSSTSCCRPAPGTLRISMWCLSSWRLTCTRCGAGCSCAFWLGGTATVASSSGYSAAAAQTLGIAVGKLEVHRRRDSGQMLFSSVQLCCSHAG